MNRAERRAVRVAALVRALGVPCRKVPHRAAVRCLWASPQIQSLRYYQRWRIENIARMVALGALTAIREDFDDVERTLRMRGMDGWKEMVESGRWPKNLTPR